MIESLYNISDERNESRKSEPVRGRLSRSSPHLGAQPLLPQGQPAGNESRGISVHVRLGIASSSPLIRRNHI